MPDRNSKLFGPLSCSLLVIGCFCVSSSSIFLGFGANSLLNPRTTTSYIYSDTVYIKNNGFDWIDEDSTEAQNLLATAKNHFDIVFEVDNIDTYRQIFKSYEDFILVNMENQYRHLQAELDFQLDKKVKITILDTAEKYKSKSQFTWEGDLDFSGFADYNNNIFILIPENRLPSRDILSDVMTHELVHTFHFNIQQYNSSLPTWYIEGMAEHYSTGGKSINYRLVNRLFPDINSLENGFEETNIDKVRQAYSISQSFYEYLKKVKPSELESLLKIGFFDNFETKFTELFGKTSSEVYNDYILSTQS